MKKFANLAYDATDFITEGKIDYLAALVKDAEGLAKQAHVPSREEIDTEPAENFALVLYHPQTGLLKKYATSDKYITQLNLKIFADQCNSYPDEIAKTAAHYLTKAAKYFKISVPPEIESLGSGAHISNYVDVTQINQTAFMNKKAGMKKQAAQIIYALPEKEKYPIQTPELVSQAIAYFNKYAAQFDPIDALEFANRVSTEAKKSNVSVENTKIAEYCRLTKTAFSKNLKSNLAVRKTYVKEEDSKIYDELLEKSAEFGVLKTAEYLDQVDRALGLDREWNHFIPDPYISVLGMAKLAEYVEHNGKKIKKAAMLKAAENVVDSETLKDLTGPEGLNVFNSLPSPIKDKLIQ